MLSGHHVLSLLDDSGKLILGQIQKFARHRRRSTTENYLHVMKGLEDALEVLEQENLRDKSPKRSKSLMQSNARGEKIG